jgi:flagellar biosynthesis protein FlhF
LLIHAGAREQVMARTVDYYKPLNISRMLPTHVDWCRQLGPFLNLTARHPWPIAYLGTGPQVPEDLQLLTARQLAAMMVGRPAGPESQAVEDLPGMSQSAPSGQYVANRNSDIFHDRSCKYVQRMNDDNMLIFKDSADAIDQGFIACRLCCMAHLVPKPIDRPAHPRFAGSRN